MTVRQGWEFQLPMWFPVASCWDWLHYIGQHGKFWLSTRATLIALQQGGRGAPYFCWWEWSPSCYVIATDTVRGGCYQMVGMRVLGYLFGLLWQNPNRSVEMQSYSLVGDRSLGSHLVLAGYMEERPQFFLWCLSGINHYFLKVFCFPRLHLSTRESRLFWNFVCTCWHFWFSSYFSIKSETYMAKRNLLPSLLRSRFLTSLPYSLYLSSLMFVLYITCRDFSCT